MPEPFEPTPSEPHRTVCDHFWETWAAFQALEPGRGSLLVLPAILLSGAWFWYVIRPMGQDLPLLKPCHQSTIPFPGSGKFVLLGIGLSVVILLGRAWVDNWRSVLDEICSRCLSPHENVDDWRRFRIRAGFNHLPHRQDKTHFRALLKVTRDAPDHQPTKDDLIKTLLQALPWSDRYLHTKVYLTSDGDKAFDAETKVARGILTGLGNEAMNWSEGDLVGGVALPKINWEDARIRKGFFEWLDIWIRHWNCRYVARRARALCRFGLCYHKLTIPATLVLGALGVLFWLPLFWTAWIVLGLQYLSSVVRLNYFANHCQTLEACGHPRRQLVAQEILEKFAVTGVSLPGVYVLMAAWLFTAPVLLTHGSGVEPLFAGSRLLLNITWSFLAVGFTMAWPIWCTHRAMLLTKLRALNDQAAAMHESSLSSEDYTRLRMLQDFPVWPRFSTALYALATGLVGLLILTFGILNYLKLN